MTNFLWVYPIATLTCNLVSKGAQQGSHRPESFLEGLERTFSCLWHWLSLADYVYPTILSHKLYKVFAQKILLTLTGMQDVWSISLFLRNRSNNEEEMP